MDLPYEKQFHFRDGTAVATLEQLKNKIESISYQEFYHHVNSQKNDFSAWIRHVLHEERLADDLEKVTSIVETVEIINDYLHPRPVEVPRIDTQSRIERSIFSTPMPADTSEQLVIEQVPTVTPAPLSTKETAELKIIEEPTVARELFSASQPKESSQQASPAGLEHATSEHHADDMSRMIVKDFMYGLVFGLIVGLVLGRLLTF